MFNIETLQSKSATDLAKITKDLGVKLAKNSTENDKIFAILDFQASNTKVAKDYFNATETPMNTEEKSTPAPKKPVAKKPAPRKKVEKPAEVVAEKPVEAEIPEAEPVQEVKAEETKEVVAEKTVEVTKTANSQRKKRPRTAPADEDAVSENKTTETTEEKTVEVKKEVPRNPKQNQNQTQHQ